MVAYHSLFPKCPHHTFADAAWQEANTGESLIPRSPRLPVNRSVGSQESGANVQIGWDLTWTGLGNTVRTATPVVDWTRRFVH